MSIRRHHPNDTATAFLTGIGLRNFKSVPQCDVPIGPLTVVTGANSSGKSSLLQVVLALTQMSRRRISGGRLQLNDDLTRLGTFASLKHQRACEDTPIAIKTEYSVSRQDLQTALAGEHASRNVLDPDRADVDSRTPMSWTIEMDAAVDDQAGSARISAIEVRAAGEDVNLTARVERSSNLSRLGRVQGPRGERQAYAYSGYVSSGSSSDRVDDARIESAQIRVLYEETPELMQVAQNFIGWLKVLDVGDSTVAEDFDLADPDFREDIRWYIRQTIEEDREILGASLIDPDEFYWDLVLDAARDMRMGRPVTDRFRAFVELLGSTDRLLVRQEILESYFEAMEQIETGKRSGLEPVATSGELRAVQDVCASYLASSVYYVGPLRNPPNAPFPTAPDPDSGNVGAAGEHVAAVLQANGAIERAFPQPTSLEEYPPDESRALDDAVNQWLRYLGLADSMTVREDTPLVLGVSITPPGLQNPVPLGSVGVGVSQVLPVIVQCLTAGPGALVILEQPELHLHPAAQQRLADFLIACTNWGQRFLIESHSEHLVLRLRRRIAEDQSDSLRDQVVILFAERDNVGDTTYREVEVTESGGVLEWPQGFFDQGPDDAHRLLVAAANRASGSDG